MRGLCGIGPSLGPTQPNLGHCVATSHQKLPRRHRLSGVGTPSLDLSLYLMPSFGGDDASATFPKHRPVSTGPALQAWPPATLWLIPTPVLRYPTVVIAAGTDNTRPQ